MTDKPNKLEVEGDPESDEEVVDEVGMVEVLLKSLGMAARTEQPKVDESEPLLQPDELDMEGIAKAIKDGRLKHIIVMTGAGISVEAGIPDFRTPGTGLYSNLQKYNLNRPEDIFDIQEFTQNPKPFCMLAKELFPGSYLPTPAHYFIRLLHEKGVLLRNFTQNIDTLEREAGIDGDQIVEAHGSFAAAHCITCKKKYTSDFVKSAIMADDIPTCVCGGYVKPDIVFFRENLPAKYFELSKTDFPKCDLLIVMGTSLAVQPFAGLINRVPKNCIRLLINREKVGVSTLPAPLMRILNLGGEGFDFDKKPGCRDACWLGDVQQGCREFVNLLGWDKEFSDLLKIREQHPAYKPTPAPVSESVPTPVSESVTAVVVETSSSSDVEPASTTVTETIVTTDPAPANL